MKTNNLPILREQDRFFNEVFSDFFGDRSAAVKFSKPLSCDIQEVEGHYVFSLDVPGVKKEDIKVEIKKGHLSITAVKANQFKSGDRNFLKRERAYGEFQRSFPLSDDIDTDNIEASYQDGVLNLVLSKKAEQKPNLVEIKSEKSSLIDKITGK